MIIRIDLLRHGVAHSTHAAGDAARELTPDGAAAVRALGERLGLAAWRPERVFSSPYVRARETTRIVLAAASVPIAAEVLAELEPDHDPHETARALAVTAGNARHLLVVAHQPLLGRLATWWTGRPMGLSPGQFLSIVFDDAPSPGAGRTLETLPGA